MKGKFEYFYGHHSDCPGKMIYTFYPQITTYRDVYQTERGRYVSPIRESYTEKTIQEGDCEQ